MATQQGDTVAVGPGVTSAQVLGTFVAPYEIGVVTGWATDRWVLPVDKLATGFIVNFANAPAVASSFDWGVLGT